MERRVKPRIEGAFPATVCATDARGESFEIEAVLDNLSVSGLHVTLRRQVEVAAALFAIIRFAGMEVEAWGVVRRVEAQPEVAYGLGVEFTRYRLIGPDGELERKKSSST